jgi:hypothetical protein
VGVGYTGETVGSFVTVEKDEMERNGFCRDHDVCSFPRNDDASFGILVFCYSLAEDAHLGSSTPAAI